jgi:DNA-binding NarL/FixJ family response regulator
LNLGVSEHDLEMLASQAEQAMARKVRTKVNGVSFTNREWQIIQLIGEARSNKDIASILNIRETTLKVYFSNIYSKIRFHHPDLVRKSMRVLLAQWALGFATAKPLPEFNPDFVDEKSDKF